MRLGQSMSSLPTFKLVLNQLIIPFKVKFRHASAERAETSSIWVEAISTSGIIGYGESCPRSYVTGETMASVQHFFLQYQDAICKEISNLNTLREWAATHQHALDANPAAWCAIELAILDLLAKQDNKTIEQLLNLPALRILRLFSKAHSSIFSKVLGILSLSFRGSLNAINKK
jgi:L-Ala-D/L-Glu epimerase